MMKKRRRNILPLRFYSMLLHTVLVLLVLILLNGSIAILSTRSKYRQHYFETISSASFDQLSQYSAALNRIADECQGQMSALYRHESPRRLMISGKDINSTRLLDTLRELTELRDDNTYIEDAAIYLPKADQVLMAGNKVLTPKSSGYEDLLSDMSSGLVVSEGNIYLKKVYPEAKPLILILCRLDKKACFDRLAEHDAYEKYFSYIFTFSSQGEQVFAGSRVYPKEELLEVTEEVSQKAGADGEGHRVFRAKDGYIQVLTGESGFLFVRRMDDSVFSAGDSLRYIWVILIPAVISLILGAFYLIHMIFRPFEHMLWNLVKSRSGEDMDKISIEAANELELIRNITEDDAAMRKRYQQMLPLARESLQQSLLRRLIEGSAGKEEAALQLAGIESQWPASGLFGVIRIYRTDSADHKKSELREEMCRILILAVSRDFWKERALCQIFPAENHKQTILICGNSGGKDKQILTRQLEEFKEHLRERLEEQDYFCRMESVMREAELAELAVLTEEAELSLQKKLYYAEENSPSEMPGQLSAEEEQTMDRIIWDALSDGDAFESLRERCRNLLGRMKIDHPSGGRELRQSILDQMTENLLKNHVEISDEMRKLRSQADSESGEAYDMAEAYLAEGLRCLQSVAKNEQYRYVQRVCRKIEENYSDSTLSLESVSDELGISSQYLSRIFSQWKDKGFLTWLTEYRVEQAKVLLVETGITVSEIGLKTGFSSAQSFIRVFKRYTKVTPGQYRKEKAL